MPGRSGCIFNIGLESMRGAPSFTALGPPPLGSGNITANDVQPWGGLFISADTPHPDACWRWLRYLVADQSFAALADGFPANQRMAQSEAFQARAPAGASAILTAYRSALEDAPPDLLIDGPFYAAPLDYYWFFRAVDRALQGGDLEQELADAQERTERHLACVRSGATAGICARQVDPDYQGFAAP
jgi:ABC-type glycerol-3-phosphate transport system substrate-binding protein